MYQWVQFNNKINKIITEYHKWNGSVRERERLASVKLYIWFLVVSRHIITLDKFSNQHNQTHGQDYKTY